MVHPTKAYFFDFHNKTLFDRIYPAQAGDSFQVAPEERHERFIRFAEGKRWWGPGPTGYQVIVLPSPKAMTIAWPASGRSRPGGINPV